MPRYKRGLNLDTEAQGRWRVQETLGGAIERRQRTLLHHIQSNTVTVEDDEGRDTSSVLAQMGRPMTCQAVMAKLKKCNALLRFEQSISDKSKMGVYIVDDSGTYKINDQKVKFLFGMEFGILPEFSVIHKKTMRVPKAELLGSTKPTREVEWDRISTFADETRGWRTVLARLLHQGFISQLDVERHFGWTPSHDSKRWHEQTA